MKPPSQPQLRKVFQDCGWILAAWILASWFIFLLPWLGGQDPLSFIEGPSSLREEYRLAFHYNQSIPAQWANSLQAFFSGDWGQSLLHYPRRTVDFFMNALPSSLGSAVAAFVPGWFLGGLLGSGAAFGGTWLAWLFPILALGAALPPLFLSPSRIFYLFFSFIMILGIKAWMTWKRSRMELADPSTQYARSLGIRERQLFWNLTFRSWLWPLPGEWLR
ncbi:MAG TPA: hypothetical protein VLM37_03810, partial [Fibrobacteraceae bacterium]|nr:hypothetical protein [Fibrobacteraceae bacterium]